jgi:hypothetical protein
VSRTARDLGIALGTFAAVSAIAALLGAVNAGTAMTFGQIAFVIAVIWIILTS